jgi:hypothetical protein
MADLKLRTPEEAGKCAQFAVIAPPNEVAVPRSRCQSQVVIDSVMPLTMGWLEGLRYKVFA